MTDIEWAEPPPDSSTKGRNFIIADRLRERPGEWALTHRGVSPGVPSSMKKSPAYQPPSDFEITTRKVGNDYAKRDVYVRYVGQTAVKP